MFKKYFEYPKPFKVLVLATFIDRFGGFLLFPYFSIYIVEHFGVPWIAVGLMFTMFSAGSIIGSAIGGAFADKYGRRLMILFGLIASATGNIILGLLNNLILFYIVAILLGILGDFGGPARQAMVADLLGKEKQAEGFGILRVAVIREDLSCSIRVVIVHAILLDQVLHGIEIGLEAIIGRPGTPGRGRCPLIGKINDSLPVDQERKRVAHICLVPRWSSILHHHRTWARIQPGIRRILVPGRNVRIPVGNLKE